MQNPKIDWYGRDELRTMKATSEPDTVAQIEPVINTEAESVAKNVPEYPATVTEADEVENTEITEDDKTVIEQGE